MTKSMCDAIKGFRSSRVIIVGDIMLDEYQWGRVERISPEAPVPIVSIEKSDCLLGGAGNVARNIKALGGQPYLLSICGDDRNGKDLEKLLEQQGVLYRLLHDKDRSTSLKTRVIAEGQHIVRIDKECLSPISNMLEKELCGELEKNTEPYGIIIVSDYGKGVLTSALRDCLNKLTQERKCRVLIDPKPINFPLYPQAFIMTPNKKESLAASKIHLKEDRDVQRVGEEILKKYALQNLLITLGSKGMLLLQEDEKIYHIPTLARQVFDVTGAGDTVIATLGTALAAGLDLLKSCVLANYAAGFAVGQLGATAVSAKELQDWIEKTPPPQISMWR